MKIRVAEKADCPRLLELVHALAIYEKAPEEVTVSLQEFEDAGFGPKPVWKAFVGEIDGMVQGFALYYVRFSTWKGCRLYLEDFFVAEEHRSKGLGKLLFETVLEEARDKGFNGVSWQVLEWNQPAINFYKKYKARFDAEWINVSIEKEALNKLSY